MLKRQFHEYTQHMSRNNQLFVFSSNSLKKENKKGTNKQNIARLTANQFLPFKLVSYAN